MQSTKKMYQTWCLHFYSIDSTIFKGNNLLHISSSFLDCIVSFALYNSFYVFFSLDKDWSISRNVDLLEIKIIFLENLYF